MIYWYCLLFLSFTYDYFLLRLLCFPRQLFIPNVERSTSESFCSENAKEWPYNDRIISFFGANTSFIGLLDGFLNFP